MSDGGSRRGIIEATTWGSEVGEIPNADYRRWALRYGMPKGILEALRQASSILGGAARGYSQRGAGAGSRHGALFNDNGPHPAFFLEVSAPAGMTTDSALGAAVSDLKSYVIQSRIAKVEGDGLARATGPDGEARTELDLVTGGFKFGVRLVAYERVVKK